MLKSTPHVQPDENPTVVAVDRDRHSHSALLWAINNLLAKNPTIILVHVKVTKSGENLADPKADDVLANFRTTCVRKKVATREIVLQGSQVYNALVDYLNSHHVTNLVLGASTRNALTRRIWSHDVPTMVNKAAPEYCSVYVIAKGKIQSVRPGVRIQASPTPPRFPSPLPPARFNALDQEDGGRPSFGTGERKSTGIEPSRRSRRMVAPNGSSDNRQEISNRWSKNSIGDGSEISSRGATSRSFPETDMSEPVIKIGMMDMGETADQDLNSAMDIERLRLEVQHTINMYNNACKEAVSAQQRAEILKQSKKDEASKLELAKQAEEKALALVEIEKAKSRAAMEAAEKAQKLAEQEAQRRKYAEMRARQEAEEKKRALDVLQQNDTRYRKYSIEEIETATNKFANSMKIGEGGYGPVFKGVLDHTSVAIKVLRPDAAQGKQQFQQEVEVLSTMRHPNMVLLMGACPEYGCLVYEYMNYGSLEDRIFRKNNTPPIPWGIRFKLAADIATGLLFLHQAKPEPLVHRDLKPANILLDRNFTCKISDVGLARLVPPAVADSVTQYHMTSAAGTFCYIDPEYQQTGKLGTKSDIYSLGVLLLQIITARPPMGLTHQIERAIERGKFETLLDPSILVWPVAEATGYAKLALRCTELRKRDRPDLATVILPELNRLKEIGMEDVLGNHVHSSF